MLTQANPPLASPHLRQSTTHLTPSTPIHHSPHPIYANPPLTSPHLRQSTTRLTPSTPIHHSLHPIYANPPLASPHLRQSTTRLTPSTPVHHSPHPIYANPPLASPHLRPGLSFIYMFIRLEITLPVARKSSNVLNNTEFIPMLYGPWNAITPNLCLGTYFEFALCCSVSALSDRLNVPVNMINIFLFITCQTRDKIPPAT